LTPYHITSLLPYTTLFRSRQSKSTSQYQKAWRNRCRNSADFCQCSAYKESQTRAVRHRESGSNDGRSSSARQPHLTRIRPKKWVFQEKCPIFGSNPLVECQTPQNRGHGSEFTDSVQTRQSETARSCARRET